MKPVIIAGPCVIESQELLETVAGELVRLNKKYDTEIIFKASFDKANRTSISSFRGPGLEKGLQRLADI
ncbi:MAG: 3-deoxy-8-phosphooctulonate synthase, partial [Prevotella sp.]|nr:3-deoxy-8-phosphooctulonate synthase [Prevotella sp.]